MSQRHTVTTDDFEDYAPTIVIAGHANGSVSKRIEAEISFTRDINSGRNVGRVVFSVSAKKNDDNPFVTEFLDEAIEKYNSI